MRRYDRALLGWPLRLRPLVGLWPRILGEDLLSLLLGIIRRRLLLVRMLVALERLNVIRGLTF